jgi:serine phosphatase RsbU (regulator of sigma subunit)
LPADPFIASSSPAPASGGSPAPARLHLVPLVPEIPPLTLAPDARATIGRRAGCTLVVPHAEVSRLHAELFSRGGTWFVIDQESRAGTRIEEQAIEAGVPTPLADGDRVSFGPGQYLVRIGRDAPAPLELADVAAEPEVRVASTLGAAGGATSELLRFATVLRSLAGAGGRDELYARTATIAVEATGHGRAAIVEAAGTDARSLVTAVERDETGRPRPIDPQTGRRGRPYSRRLVESALAGESVALMGRGEPTLHLNTVAELAIEDAVCVPIRVSERVRACLYLDRRADEAGPHPQSSALAELLAAACGLALGNLVRAELEGRQRRLHFELEAAQRAQQGLLPAPDGSEGPVRWAMRMDPGLVVAGDLFDVIAIDADRTAVITGDVAGHGIGPGIQMAMVQAVLRTELERTGDVADAVERAHRLAVRSFSHGQFVTLWAGIIDASGTVQYVDAGHGHVRTRRADGRVETPELVGNTPVGFDLGRAFAAGTFTLDPGDQLVLYSDGLVEQSGEGGGRFDDAGLAAALADGPRDPAALVAHVAARVDAFRGVTARTDDMTIAVIERT